MMVTCQQADTVTILVTHLIELLVIEDVDVINIKISIII